MKLSRRDLYFVMVDDQPRKLPGKPDQLQPLDPGFRGYVGLHENGDGLSSRSFQAQTMADAAALLEEGESAMGVAVGRIGLGVVWRAVVVGG